MPRQKIAEGDIDNFATLLYRWSCSESSYFLRQFWRTFGMSEMQFYKRVWKAQDQIKEFDFPDIKKNLRRNRFARNLLKKEKYHGKKTIRVNFHRETDLKPSPESKDHNRKDNLSHRESKDGTVYGN